MFYGKFFRWVRHMARALSSTYKFHGEISATEPSVYICWHQDLHGPLTCMMWLPTTVHFWANYELCQVRAAIKHFRDYTFRQRCNMPGLLAALLSGPAGYVAAHVCQSAQAIPVFRDINSVQTIRQTIEVLRKGENILLFPDIDYTNRVGGGQVYDGFLYLERFYFRNSGKHLRFIPLYLDDEERQIIAAPAVSFSDSDFEEQKPQIIAEIKQGLSGPRG